MVMSGLRRFLLLCCASGFVLMSAALYESEAQEGPLSPPVTNEAPAASLFHLGAYPTHHVLSVPSDVRWHVTAGNRLTVDATVFFSSKDVSPKELNPHQMWIELYNAEGKKIHTSIIYASPEELRKDRQGKLPVLYSSKTFSKKTSAASRRRKATPIRRIAQAVTGALSEAFATTRSYLFGGSTLSAMVGTGITFIGDVPAYQYRSTDAFTYPNECITSGNPECCRCGLGLSDHAAC